MSGSSWLDRARTILDPLVRALARAGVSPTAVTLSGLVLHVVAGLVIGLGHPRSGGLLLVVAGLCDALDGSLARATGSTSRFGAFLDSTVDRVDETVVLAGVTAYFLRGTADGPGLVLAVVVLLALAGSLLTSYARARAEGLGLECKVGLLERPHRVIATILGLLLGWTALVAAILLILVFSWFTVLQRVRHVRATLTRTEVSSGMP